MNNGDKLESRQPGNDPNFRRFKQTSDGKALGEGNLGSVRAGKFDVTNDANEIRELGLAVKTFKSEYSANRAKFRHTLCKNAGLPVIPFYEPADDKLSIVMTDLTRGGRCVVESHNSEKYETDGVRLDRIDNVDVLARHLLSVAQKAADAGLRIFADSVFFIFLRTEKPGSVVCAVGDYDTVKPGQVHASSPHASLFQKNSDSMFRAFDEWIKHRNEAQGGGLQQEELSKRVKDILQAGTTQTGLN